MKKSLRATEGRILPARRTVSPGAKRRASPEGVSLKDETSTVSPGAKRRASPAEASLKDETSTTGVYIEIPEDPEHRRNARSRAQQIFSQALSPQGGERN